MAASFHLPSVSTANINTVQYTKPYQQYEIPKIPAVVISKVLFPQSNIMTAFVHSNSTVSLISLQACQNTATVPTASIPQLLGYSRRNLSSQSANTQSGRSVLQLVTATGTTAAALLLQKETGKACPVPVASSNVVSTNRNDDTLAYITEQCH